MAARGLGRDALMAAGAAAAGAAIGLSVWTAWTATTAEESTAEASVTAVRRRRIARPMVITGTLVHSLDVSTLEVLEGHSIGVGLDGKIAFVGKADEAAALCVKHGLLDPELITLDCDDGTKQFLMPGMVDAHVHASQYPYSGTGYDLPLLQWLTKYTFPTEAKYANADYATEKYTKAVDRFVRNGTTTACYFATIDRESSLILADVVEKAGQRAYIGKVCMDCNSPDFYVEESAGTSAAETVAFVQEMLARASDRILPVVTPRFVPTCTSELMGKLGDIAKENDIPIQSHLSESFAECEWVKELHPDCASYTDVYDKYNLLTEKTVMAHCIHLSDEEIAKISERKTGIAHCPNSNFSLMSGVLDIRRLLANGVKVGLGTDVAGGYHPSILDAARQAITASKLSHLKDKDYAPLSYQEAFFLATLGGSRCLALEDKIGNFLVGKYFDAIIVDPSIVGTPIDVHGDDTFQDVLSKFIYLGDDRNIRRVFVAGDEVVGEA
jgi:guanine deaminase